MPFLRNNWCVGFIVGTAIIGSVRTGDLATVTSASTIMIEAIKIKNTGIIPVVPSIVSARMLASSSNWDGYFYGGI